MSGLIFNQPNIARVIGITASIVSHRLILMRKNRATMMIMIPSSGRKIPEQANQQSSRKSWSRRWRTSPAGKRLVKEWPFLKMLLKTPVLSLSMKVSFVQPRQYGSNELKSARNAPSAPSIITYLIRSWYWKFIFIPSILTFNYITINPLKNQID